jgi:hypothetical protein
MCPVAVARLMAVVVTLANTVTIVVPFNPVCAILNYQSVDLFLGPFNGLRTT